MCRTHRIWSHKACLPPCQRREASHRRGSAACQPSMDRCSTQPEDKLVIGRALAQFLIAPDWQVAVALIVRYPILLSQTALDLLGELVADAHQRGYESDVLILQRHLEVLKLSCFLSLELMIGRAMRAQPTQCQGIPSFAGKARASRKRFRGGRSDQKHEEQ
jgi:hypothetical protein